MRLTSDLLQRPLCQWHRVMLRTMAGVIGMHLGYQSWKTGCEGGAMTSLTAVPIAEHVRVAAGQPTTLSAPQLTGDSGALSSCCCCYSHSRNKRRFEHLERHGTPLREPVKRCNRDCKWFCLFGQAAPALQVRLSFPSSLDTLVIESRGSRRPSPRIICAGGTVSEAMPSMMSL
jgi:hypothetical protein